MRLTNLMDQVVMEIPFQAYLVPALNIQVVPFLFVPLQTGITQRLKMINVICKRKKTALGRTILLTRFHLSLLIIKIITAILVKGDSFSKQI